MSRKRREEEQRQKEEKRRRRKRTLLAGAAVVCLCAVVTVGLYFLRQTGDLTATLEEGALVVPLGSIGRRATLIRYGGTQDILAYKDAGGNIHTAFDTCEECFEASARYSVEGSTLTCSACGNTYSQSGIGLASWGGCQPVAVPASYRVDTGANMVIPAAVLEYAEEMFGRWQGGDYSVTMEQYFLD